MLGIGVMMSVASMVIERKLLKTPVDVISESEKSAGGDPADRSKSSF
jgi:hypothetical protein